MSFGGTSDGSVVSVLPDATAEVPITPPTSDKVAAENKTKRRIAHSFPPGPAAPTPSEGRVTSVRTRNHPTRAQGRASCSITLRFLRRDERVQHGVIGFIVPPFTYHLAGVGEPAGDGPRHLPPVGRTSRPSVTGDQVFTSLKSRGWPSSTIGRATPLHRPPGADAGDARR